MCTSQFSEASSAVWIRLSGIRSRSALRSVTWTTSQTVVSRRAGDLAGEAEAGKHAVRVVVGAPADVGEHAGTRASVPNALAHNATATRFSSSGSSPGHQQLDLPAAWRASRRGCSSTTSMPARRRVRGASSCRRVNCAGVSPPAGSTSTRTTAVLMSASLSAGRKDAMTRHNTDLTVAVWPGIDAAAAAHRRGHRGLRRVPRLGGYQPLDEPDALLEQVDLSGLLGRGGAAFPLAVKLRDGARRRPRGPATRSWSPTARRANRRRSRIVGCCGNRPHLVLDGLRLAARIVGAEHALRLCLGSGAADAVRIGAGRGRRRRARRSGRQRVSRSNPATSPVRRPPRCGPSTVGRPSRPTSRRGRSKRASAASRRWSAMSRRLRSSAVHAPPRRRGVPQQGTSMSPGTFLATITGAGRPPALYEIPHGIPFSELLELHGVPAEDVTAC